MCLSLYVCWFICLSVCLSVCLSICLRVPLSVRLLVHLSVCLSVWKHCSFCSHSHEYHAFVQVPDRPLETFQNQDRPLPPKLPERGNFTGSGTSPEGDGLNGQQEDPMYLAVISGGNSIPPPRATEQPVPVPTRKQSAGSVSVGGGRCDPLLYLCEQFLKCVPTRARLNDHACIECMVAHSSQSTS